MYPVTSTLGIFFAAIKIQAFQAFLPSEWWSTFHSSLVINPRTSTLLLTLRNALTALQELQQLPGTVFLSLTHAMIASHIQAIFEHPLKICSNSSKISTIIPLLTWLWPWLRNYEVPAVPDHLQKTRRLFF